MPGQALDYSALAHQLRPFLPFAPAGGGGTVPPGGTTGQFLRGDNTWANTLVGGLNLGSAVGAGSGDLRLSGALTAGSLAGVLKATAGLVSGGATTTDLPEGSNLYFTNARVAA